jgi:hypothetical protein
MYMGKGEHEENKELISSYIWSWLLEIIKKMVGLLRRHGHIKAWNAYCSNFP